MFSHSLSAAMCESEHDTSMELEGNDVDSAKDASCYLSDGASTPVKGAACEVDVEGVRKGVAAVVFI